MSAHSSKSSSLRTAVVLGCLLVAVVATKSRWMPRFQKSPPPAGGEADGGLADAGHNHASPPQTASIKLSANGLKNIGFEPFVVEPADYDKKLALPAIVVERPGRSQLHITAPLTGIVTKIYAVPGEAITADQPLFDLRLTHEELVAAQREFLRTAENLEVINREIRRLKTLDEGVIAGRRILEQEYEKQKLEASLHAERQAMLLHGIGEQQIEKILETRRLFQSLTVCAPSHEHDEDICAGDHLFLIQRLGIAQGQQVEAGKELAILADHCELHIEAQAFEDDAAQIREAVLAERKVAVCELTKDSPGPIIDDLSVQYVSDQIDPSSRALKIFLRLPNEVVLDKRSPGGKRFIEWRYKPGQRMQINVPVETWQDKIVLPTTALVDEGAEAYVYRQNGDHFDQVSVHVLHRDPQAVVVANDGALFSGDILAGKGAYQMHLALKNQAGGGIDPHAGHNH